MKIQYDPRIITKSEMKEINHTRYVNTISKYFYSLGDAEHIDPLQFYAIVKMMKKFPKLFGCMYNILGYDEVSELLEPVVRLYHDLLNRRRQAMLDSDVYVPSGDMFYAEKYFRKICRLYGVEVD